MNTGITNQSEENEPLDTLLRERIAYIEDRGFTARVIRSLPRRKAALLRPVVLLSASAIGFALSICWLPWKDLPPFDTSTLFSQNPHALAPWLLVFTVISSLAWAVITALRGEDNLI